MKRNRFAYIGTLALIGTSMLLASCSNKHPDYPTDYDDSVVTVTGSDGEVTVPFNLKRQYYSDIGTISSTAVDRILDVIAQKVTAGNVYDDDGNAYTLYSSQVGDGSSSTTLPYVTGLNDDGTLATEDMTYTGLAGELDTRAKKAFAARVNTGSFDVNNKFDEKKFILSLNASDLAGITIPDDLDNLSKVLNKTSTFDEIFGDDADLYSDFMTSQTYWTLIENKLTAQYIYNERYSSIYNYNARKVSVVALADRSDDKGAANKLINAYFDYLDTHDGNTISPAYADNPVEELSVLWKGIGGYTDKTAADMPADSGIDPANLPDDLYSDFLTQDEKDFLVSNKLDTLYDGVMDDLAKITPDNTLTNDTDLYESYTGTYTYSLEEGFTRKLDSIIKEDVLTDGIYQKSDLSSLPTSVTSRIYSSSPDDVRASFPAAGDNVTSHKYVTSGSSQNDTSSDGSNLTGSDLSIFDSSSDTYYVVMMDDDGIFTRSTLGTQAENEADEELRAKAMDVAYEMVGSSTYRTDSIVYWIKNYVGDGKLQVNNETFYDYLNTNYPKLFDDDDDD